MSARLSKSDISENFKHCEYKTNCVRKCCEIGYKFIKNKCLKNNSTAAFAVPVFNQTYFVGTIGDSAKYRVDEITCQVFRLNNSNPDEVYFPQEDGSLWVPLYKSFYANARYCLDEVDKLSAFLCFPEEFVPEPMPVLRKTNAVGRDSFNKLIPNKKHYLLCL